MSQKRSERFRSKPLALFARKRIVITGLVVLMVVFAGCGGDPDDGGTTTAANKVSPNGAQTSNPSTGMAPETQTRTSSLASTTHQGVMTNAGKLNVTVVPTRANSTNVTLIVHATVTHTSATKGIETITVGTGGGLDLSNVTISNVKRMGIDNGGTLPGNQTDESLASHVERNINETDDGKHLTIPLDGIANIEASDELVAVVDGGIATKQAGAYSFSVTVDEGPTQMDKYNITIS